MTLLAWPTFWLTPHPSLALKLLPTLLLLPSLMPAEVELPWLWPTFKDWLAPKLALALPPRLPPMLATPGMPTDALSPAFTPPPTPSFSPVLRPVELPVDWLLSLLVVKELPALWLMPALWPPLRLTPWPLLTLLPWPRLTA